VSLWEARVTTQDQLRDIVQYLQNLVILDSGGERTIQFAPPGAEEMSAAGLDGSAVQRLLDSPWWTEMVDDVIETPEFAEPDETAEQVLAYARDVIQEYVRKRFSLES